MESQRQIIYLVSLGICGYAQVTKEAEQFLRTCNAILYLHPEPGVKEYLRGLCPVIKDLYGFYAEGKMRDLTYCEMAEAVISAAQINAPVAFTTYGHVGVYCKPSQLIRTKARKLGMAVKMLPGVSAFDTLFVDLEFDPCEDGLQAFEATDLIQRKRSLQPDVALFVWQPGVVGSALFTRHQADPNEVLRLKLHLLDFYPAEHIVTVVTSAMNPIVAPKITTVRLCDLESIGERMHASSTLYVPAVKARSAGDSDSQSINGSAHQLV
jgi:uncharacterized protein YabN with tetrapyrrole methylase and pyrophosphatase domain